MLVLKVGKGEKVSLFDDQGRELGKVGFDNTNCGPASVRLVFDFDKGVKIFRDTVIEKSDTLRANLTFRNE
jgi:hypothetical protein